MELPVILPRMADNVGYCDDDCPQYDGKRCRLMGRRPDRICEPWAQRLAGDAAQLREEVARLKAGRFTQEELQALCHEQGEDCPERFAAGCVAYNERLFGERSRLKGAAQLREGGAS